jgi:8-amino-7-oxononanoate synthase
LGVSLDDEARAELEQLEARNRRRTPRVVSSMQGPRIAVDGIDVVSFASNDYLSLAGDQRLARAASNAALESGTGVGSSRLLVGNHREHVALEETIADWLGYSGALLFNSGYAANVGVLTTLLGPGDVVFSDELNHASIIDGCRLSRAEVVVYPHLDVSTLERQLAGRRSARRRLVVSESLFSMDGDIADLEALRRISSEADAALMVDEAHAIGVWGAEGRGLAAAANIRPDMLVGTAGKALGSFGAFVASSRAIAALLWTRARSLVFSTGLPPGTSAATRIAIEIVRGTEGAALRRRLAEHAMRLRAAVRGLGGAKESAIAPLIVGDDARVMSISAALLERVSPTGDRYFVQGIRPPTVPEGTARLRVSLSAGHTSADVDGLAGRLERST